MTQLLSSVSFCTYSPIVISVHTAVVVVFHFLADPCHNPLDNLTCYCLLHTLYIVVLIENKINKHNKYYIYSEHFNRPLKTKLAQNTIHNRILWLIKEHSQPFFQKTCFNIQITLKYIILIIY